MTADRLVCANCAGPVNEGRCPVCRANRARLQREGLLGGISPVALAVLAVLLIAFAAIVQHALA
ncbi:hypothetical protein BIV57_10335 [Mangrovactinospora gilvigrisea]|uniref:Uncharacterized protein n=1 Tax=Mangrovactinospora gilvigrisea TaxID=1428644 RepID=A0A1J7BFY0_9ACTN|nr:hypothetical protein [Mangrovactinospora gilvigrisea]OIV37587.1 hypothetical protein BIV57_10335 [Mangrovactinospora gilvigrisea]